MKYGAGHFLAHITGLKELVVVVAVELRNGPG
jgi:hypothetical protein